MLSKILRNIGMETDSAQPNNSFDKGEKEHEKLLAHSEAVKSVHYGDQTGASASMEKNSLTSQAGKAQDAAKLKSLAEEKASKASVKKKALKVVVTILFIIIVVGIIVIWTFHESRSRKHTGNQYFDFIPKKRVINLYNDKDNIVLTGVVKTGAFDIGQAKKCDEDQTDNVYCFTFDDGTVFRFELYELNDAQVHCSNLLWENIRSTLHVANDCFEVKYGLWYGLPNSMGSFWPINMAEVSVNRTTYQPFADDVLGQVVENYWLSSDGTAIIAHQRYPIRISWNSADSGYKKQMCLSLDYANVKPYVNNMVFNYTICQGPDIKTTFLATRNAFFPHTKVIDYGNHDFSEIIWKYDNKYNQTSGFFGDFLQKLTKNGLPMNMVEYDAQWEKYPGDFRFMQLPKNELSQYLQGMYSSTKLMLPVSLACSYLSENFQTGVGENLFVKDVHTNGFKTVTYEDQSCALWDASNPLTGAFLKDKLRALQHKDTKEETEYPQAYNFRTALTNKAIHHLLYRNTSDLFMMNVVFDRLLLSENKSVVTETAYHMQNLTSFVGVPTLIRETDGKKCLDYVIPGALTAGLHGYPYVVAMSPPDIIEEEMFMRWLEVAMLFPGVQISNNMFSFYGDEVAVLVKTLSNFRRSMIIPALVEAIHEVEKGIPLIRPMWWSNPLDYAALQMANQFFIGDSIIVAPVLCDGDRARDIYLPAGKWKQAKTRVIYTGSRWIYDFPVALEDVPVFYAYQSSVQNSTQSPVTG